MPQTIFTQHTTAIESASWAADGQTVGTSSHGGVVRVWNAENGQQMHGFFMDAQLPMRALSFAASGGQLAVGGDDGIVRLWDGLVCQQQVQAGFGSQCLDMPQRLHAHAGSVRTLAWSPDARFLATGGDDGVLAIWYPAQRQAPLLKVQHNAPVLALAWAANGKQVAAASGNNVTIWRLS
jgi:WD40 repeat protein